MTQQKEFDFEKYEIDLSKEIPEPEPILKIGEATLFTRQNISCISGAAKSRKTYLMALFSAQFLETNNSHKVIIFDTEQTRYDTQKVAKRIHRLLEWDFEKNDRLKVYCLRELNTDERKKFISDVIKEIGADLVFIDGIRDLVKDFNIVSESTDILNLLMNLSSINNVHICTILHTNKGENSTDPRGHVGTELQNKSETVIIVKKNDNRVSEVNPKFCRNKDFEKFCFMINDEGLPEFCDPPPITKKTDNLREWFNEILPTSINLSYTELHKQIMQKSGKSKSTAENYIKQATKWGIIIQNNVGKYYSADNNNNNNNETDYLPY